MDDSSSRFKVVADIVGAGAVLLGLVFVGLELRSNTEAVEAATFQNLTDISNDYVMQIAADPELARILHAARMGGLASLSPTDSTRFWSLQRAFWVRMQNVYSQHVRGTLAEEDFSLYRQVICEGDPGTRGMWPAHRQILTPDFVSFVEDCWGGQDRRGPHTHDIHERLAELGVDMTHMGLGRERELLATPRPTEAWRHVHDPRLRTLAWFGWHFTWNVFANIDAIEAELTIIERVVDERISR